MHNNASMALVLVCIVMLSGCSEDPARAGFFGGLSNMASGTYDRRQQALQDNLQDTQDKNTQKQRELERVQLQQQDVQNQYRTLERQYTAVQRDISKTRQRLQTEGGTKERATELSRNLDRIEQDIRLLQSGVQDYAAQEKILQKKTEELNLFNQEIDALLTGR